MSELKAINAYQLTTNTEDSVVYIHNGEFGCGGDLVECYLKSEADKVIAEFETKNASLAEEINEWVQSAANRPIIIGRLRQHIALLDNELSHHKYKRCFKMARWCISMMVFNSKYGTDKKWHHFKKWHERWLVLAEKFKEAK